METKRLSKLLRYQTQLARKRQKPLRIVGLFSFSQLKKKQKNYPTIFKKTSFKNFEDNNLQAKGFLLLCFTLKKKPRGTKEERTFGATVV